MPPFGSRRIAQLGQAPYFPRSRRALDVARVCQGAISAIQSGTGPDRISAAQDRSEAAIFSSSIRAYSVGEHVPCTIIKLRQPIVSQDANASSIIITGNDAGGCFFTG